jgi:hypothetical protein
MPQKTAANPSESRGIDSLSGWAVNEVCLWRDS